MLKEIQSRLDKICSGDPLLRGILVIIAGILLVCFLPTVMMYVGMGMLVTGLCMHIYQASNELTHWGIVEADPKTLGLIGIVLLVVGALASWLL